MLTNPSELHAFLNALGVKPKRGLSQNFLIDGNIVRKFLDLAAVEAGDYVLEIGSGPGAITEALLERQAIVTAVETDRTFAEALKRFETVSVVHGDILEFPLEPLTSPHKVISNLPYHLTAPILTKLVRCPEQISSVTVIVQEEVARRITAQPGTSDYSSLTIYLSLFAEVRYGFKIGRQCFYPRPKVESAVIQLVPKTPPDIDLERFIAFVRKAFQQRRKQLKSTLGTKIIPVLHQLGLQETVRPENLSLDQFLTLFLDTKDSIE